MKEVLRGENYINETQKSIYKEHLERYLYLKKNTETKQENVTKIILLVLWYFFTNEKLFFII